MKAATKAAFFVFRVLDDKPLFIIILNKKASVLIIRSDEKKNRV